MNRYRVTGPRPVLDAEPGAVLEHEFTAQEEQDLLDAGRVEIIPRPYLVVGTSRVHDTDPGGTFTLGLPVGQEAALIEGGHIERAAEAESAAAAPVDHRAGEKPDKATTAKQKPTAQPGDVATTSPEGN